MDIAELLIFAHKQGASDLHLSAGEPPRIRVHGEMMPVKVPPLEKKEVHAMIYDILNDRQRKIFEETHDMDFSMELGDVARFRVNAFMQQRGEAAVFRTIPTEVLSFDKLGLPKSMRDLAKLEKGIVLVTGPTGSGKSTTLAAIVTAIFLPSRIRSSSFTSRKTAWSASAKSVLIPTRLPMPCAAPCVRTRM